MNIVCRTSSWEVGHPNLQSKQGVSQKLELKQIS